MQQEWDSDIQIHILMHIYMHMHTKTLAVSWLKYIPRHNQWKAQDLGGNMCFLYHFLIYVFICVLYSALGLLHRREMCYISMLIIIIIIKTSSATGPKEIFAEQMGQNTLGNTNTL